MNLPATNFKQKNDWTCGPAVARIICKYYGIERKISQLVRELNTTRLGTSNRDFQKFLRRYDINFRTRKGSTVGNLKRALSNNLIIVAYWIPKYGDAHYSIVKKLDRSRIYFHDTWYGSGHSYSLDYFKKNWWDGEAKRWYLAVPK